MADVDLDARLRQAAMGWLDAREHQGLELVTSAELDQFHFEGQRVPLVDRQRGIRKPAILDAALSFRTTFTPPGQTPPCQDAEGPDGLLRYKYRGENPMHPENVALRRAFERRLPLVWFVGVAPGVYLARYPVWLVPMNLIGCSSRLLSTVPSCWFTQARSWMRKNGDMSSG